MIPHDLHFANPGFLYLLLGVPVLVFLYARRRGKATTDYRFSSLAPFGAIGRAPRERLRHLPFALRVIVLVLLIVAFARCAVRDGFGTVVTGDFDLFFSNQRPGNGGAQQVFPFVNGIGTKHREYIIAHTFFTQIFDHGMLNPE